jgi:hypothetical protein
LAANPEGVGEETGVLGGLVGVWIAGVVVNGGGGGIGLNGKRVGSGTIGFVFEGDTGLDGGGRSNRDGLEGRVGVKTRVAKTLCGAFLQALTTKPAIPPKTRVASMTRTLG